MEYGIVTSHMSHEKFPGCLGYLYLIILGIQKDPLRILN